MNDLIEERTNCLRKLSSILNAMELLINETGYYEEFSRCIRIKDEILSRYDSYTFQINILLKNNFPDPEALFTLKQQEQAWFHYLERESLMQQKLESIIQDMKNQHLRVANLKKIKKAYG